MVYLDSAAWWDKTDGTGFYRLADVPPGRYRLHFRRTGLAPRTFKILVRASATNHQTDTVFLHPVTLDAGPPPTAAISGTIRDSLDASPVAGAAVLLNSEPIAQTDSSGSFAVAEVEARWAANVLTVRRIGYQSLTDILWVDSAFTRFELTGSLRRLAVELPAVIVAGDRTIYEFGHLRGFWRRRQAGIGTYFTWWEIQDRNPIFVSDLFREVAGVQVTRDVFQGAQVRLLRRGGGCTPPIYVNGLRLLGPIDIDAFAPPDRVVGIEIYKGPATTPVQFDPTGSGCGAIVIWTR